MAKISAASIERVREAADMVELVGARTDLRRQGARWMGLCPFHDERTPSFSVNAEDKLYYCFGCEARGDVFRFVQETEGIGFGEAVEMLAERWGVELEREEEDPREAAARQRRERLSELLDRAAQFYSGYLWESREAGKVREYLSGRGLREEALREFGVGYGPSHWGALMSRAQQADFSVEELAAAGLVRRGRKGGHYDAFRSRIIFPVRDRRGRVLGFGARATSQDQGPKYVNSAETDLYRKSDTLYGIDLARSAIARAGRAILVEGYTDVIALHQAGIREAVGVMGTAITDRQVAALAGLTGELILCLDADSAGQEAMLRAQRVVSGRSLRLRVATVPGGQDPADLATGEGGAERFADLLDGAAGVEEFQVDLILAAADRSSPESRDEALRRLAPVLGQMEEGAVREELVRRASERLDLDPGLISRRAAAGGGEQEQAARQRGEARQGSSTAGGGAGGGGRRAALTPRERRERVLLAMCVADPATGKQYLERLTPEHLSSPLVSRAADWIRENPDSPAEGLQREDRDLSELVTELVMMASREPASEEAMEVNFLFLEQRRLEDEIARASAEGENERRAALNRERTELIGRLHRLGAEPSST